MKLESFKEKNRKKTGIIIFTISCILLIAGVLFYNSFALFSENKNFNVINGNVEEPGDLYFAYYVDDEIAYDMPSKDSGYTLSNKSICTNGVTISWNYNTWTAVLNYQNYQENSNSRTKCNLYFEKITFAEAVVSCGQSGVDAATCIKANKNLDTKNLKNDNTVDNNLRFVGADPNNYVSFNNELWRIIGVMENVDNGSGEKNTRLKLIRDENIGEYSWDTTEKSIDNGAGINEWSQSKIMKLLNPGYESESVGGSLYWNSGSGNCYNGAQNANTACDFTTIGIKNDAKNLIDSVLWNTGSNGAEVFFKNILTSKFYELERSENTGKICTNSNFCNDVVERKSSWKGLVGLVSPSDYGYATSGGNEDNRIICLNTNLIMWYDDNTLECRANDWLYKEGLTQATITALGDTETASDIFDIHKNGHVRDDFGYTPYAIYPSLYLKSNIRIISGTGSSTDPYKLLM